jgi:hypothetical protein
MNTIILINKAKVMKEDAKMSSYKIYLTKSSEVAHLLAHARNSDLKKEDVIGISAGAVNQDVRIPAIYHDKGYFYCAVEMKSGDCWDTPTYELIIC